MMKTAHTNIVSPDQLSLQERQLLLQQNLYQNLPFQYNLGSLPLNGNQNLGYQMPNSIQQSYPVYNYGKNIINYNDRSSMDQIIITPGSLLHSYRCQSIFCEEPNCSMTKIALFHKILCKSQQCSICYQINIVLSAISNDNNESCIKQTMSDLNVLNGNINTLGVMNNNLLYNQPNNLQNVLNGQVNHVNNMNNLSNYNLQGLSSTNINNQMLNNHLTSSNINFPTLHSTNNPNMNATIMPNMNQQVNTNFTPGINTNLNPNINNTCLLNSTNPINSYGCQGLNETIACNLNNPNVLGNSPINSSLNTTNISNIYNPLVYQQNYSGTPNNIDITSTNKVCIASNINSPNTISANISSNINSTNICKNNTCLNNNKIANVNNNTNYIIANASPTSINSSNNIVISNINTNNTNSSSDVINTTLSINTTTMISENTIPTLSSICTAISNNDNGNNLDSPVSNVDVSLSAFKHVTKGNNLNTDANKIADKKDLNILTNDIIRDFLFTYSLPFDFLQQNSSFTNTENNSLYNRKSHCIEVQWITCTKCNKKRKIPKCFPYNYKAGFQCNYNIWDSFHKSCDIPEDYSPSNKIDLSGNYPGYDIESREFMTFLTEYFDTNFPGYRIRIPCLGTKPLDIYRLFREVMAYGGCEIVTKKNGTWINIYKTLDNYTATETSASFRLKKIYKKYLLPIEDEYFTRIDDCRSSSNLNNNTK